ncbi:MULTISPECIES: DUF3465 domain-containing protein [Acinetobacter]|jgi:molybdopterin converting factor small subunit|uniref:DUF3465 domain-containing protein n=1 Tax=Acinetobacter schindleri NIPH 900 TaxID=1217675 RepID=N8XVW3_9GAMM|nr:MULTISPECIES: DUF3465 domain-containing protein [Acinetobacter]AWD69151.1 DUF3465 domain-containing protein [Acinetobacter schindleri]ENV13194.1 hypothetical protein F965_01866 [Acinetobacter schindleri NIPH 900]RAZ04981.1 DUF3465 domain-containing protein [Acinetobacter sp. SM1B]
MVNKTNIGIGAVIVLLVAAYLGLDLSEPRQLTNTFTPVQEATEQHKQQPDRANINTVDTGTARIQQAYQQRQSDIQVQGAGEVIAILKDDNEGSRHQKFILELNNGHTVLIAHNIDLAPWIPNIQKGDVVEFFGEYEYSEKGGVIHWTHHDPSRKHVDGWLKHQGRTYQ